MNKDPPPPYSAATGPEPGFHIPPPNQAPPPQGYPQPGYPPGPGGYPPSPQQATTVVVTTVPVVTQFGPAPQPITCPHCHNHVTSRLEVEPGMKTHLFAFILCMFVCIPCCLVPYCVDSCQNRNHYCPSCGAYLGSYDEMTAMAGRRGYW
ncbi:hypothetical protein ILUMI_22440 [Ignelater luminosus]|uniref:LITAF domain-containing protein n=1 Tax=Ignelater luminosus TaxID=2038154 RepID=A0A8K0CAN0_IGNLU|nr:hypothetical protein ILUMI_22440 [Ignelater luminosus]